MTNLSPELDPDAQRRRIMRNRNRVVALALIGMAVLFYLITLVRMAD